ncbi:hypothetical protein QBC38DRAFT_456527 [Podospora fimiseda]|uniref:Uncharacterized protein n=1 Tax=Podospora fimiseda TaxID=252190 RepID=A0AAN7BMW6_9PEZI|nr:hypothetical protein QBC38DRAFT_456527 [Podospora fimiseda]
MSPPRKKKCPSPIVPRNGFQLYSSKPHNSQKIIIFSDDSDSDTEIPRRLNAASTLYGSVNLMAQLKQDAFRDFKSDICAELDDIRASVTTKTKKEPDNPPTPVSPTTDSVEYLRSTLQRWTNRAKTSRPADHFYYRLDNKYSETKFCYLSRSILDRDGHALIHDIPVEHSNWLQSYLRPLTPRDGTLLEVAIVLVPRDSVADFLIPGAKSALQLTSIVEHYINAAAAQGGKRVLPVLKDICTKAWSLDQTLGLAIFPHSVVGKILKGFVLAQDFEFFEQAAAKVEGRLLSSFFRWMAEEIRTGRVATRNVEKGILAAVSTFPDAHHRCYCTATLLNLSDDDSRSLLQKLATLSLNAVDTHAPGTFHGEGLVGVVSEVLGAEAIQSVLIPVIKKHINQTSFVIGALNGLRRLPQHLAQPPKLVGRLAKLAIDALEVSTLTYTPLGPLEKISDVFGKFSVPKPVPPGAIDAERLSSFVSDLFAENKVNDAILRRLFIKIVGAADLIKVSEFSSLWFPFLRKLIGILEKNRVPQSTPRYRHLFAALLESYLLRGVGTRPPCWNPQNVIPCHCSLCATVNGFLQQPQVSTHSIGALNSVAISHVQCFVAQFSVRIQCEFKFLNGNLTISKHPGSQSAWVKWMDKKAMARAELDRFGPAKLKAILGDEDFVNVVDFDILEPEERAVDNSCHQSATTAAHPNVQPAASAPYTQAESTYKPSMIATPVGPQYYPPATPAVASYDQPLGRQPHQASQWAVQQPHSFLPVSATSIPPRPILPPILGANLAPAATREHPLFGNNKMVPPPAHAKNSVPGNPTSVLPLITTLRQHNRGTPGYGAFSSAYTKLIMAPEARKSWHTPEMIRYRIETAWDEMPEQ